MQASPQSYDELIERCTAWAQARDDIRAVFMVGSRARTNMPADQWSDLDLVIVATDPARYLADSGWIEHFGQSLCTFVEHQSVGEGLERRVLFDTFLDVDFSFLPVTVLEGMVSSGIPPEIAAVLRRGVRFVVDKDRLSQRLQIDTLPEPAAPSLPSPEEFAALCSDYLYRVVWAVKKLRRGELWIATTSTDGYLSRLLLLLMEWYAHAMHGTAVDTWHGGRFMNRWADPRAVAQLTEAFAHYDTVDVQRALMAQLALFRELAAEIAVRLGYPYPAEAAEKIFYWLQHDEK